jgi:hypothetical protein
MKLKMAEETVMNQLVLENGTMVENGEETIYSDEGFRDMCGSLLNQISHVKELYKGQLNSLIKREQSLKHSILFDGIAALVCIAVIFLLVGFVKFSEKIMVEGAMLVLYGIIKFTLPGIALIVLCLVLPTFLRRLWVNMKNYYIMNEMGRVRIVSGDIITFKQEERFLNKKLNVIETARDEHDKLEAEHEGRYSDVWDERMQNDLNGLREASVFKEYYASSLKKDSEFKQLLFAAIVVISVGIGMLYILLSGFGL